MGIVQVTYLRDEEDQAHDDDGNHVKQAHGDPPGGVTFQCTSSSTDGIDDERTELCGECVSHARVATKRPFKTYHETKLVRSDGKAADFGWHDLGLVHGNNGQFHTDVNVFVKHVSNETAGRP